MTATAEDRLHQAYRRHQADGLAAALPEYQALAKDHPDDPAVALALGAVLGDVGRTDEALQAFWGVARNDTATLAQRAHALGSLGVTYFRRKALGEAEWCYLRAVQLDPLDVSSYRALADLRTAAGRFEEAETALARTLAATPRTPEDVFTLATTHYLLADYRTGHRLYEARREVAAHRDEWVRWDRLAPPYSVASAPPSGARVLVVDEQGVGDTVQGLRWLAVLKRQRPDLRVTLAVRPALVGLVPGAVDRETVTAGEYDGYLPLWSIPAVLGLGDRIPAPWCPKGQGWRKPSSGRVYVAESGASALAHDWARSAPAGTLADAVRAAGREVVTYRDGQTWAETADVLRACDAAVCVDTGVAHLAATLGVPTLVCPPAVAEWRWGWGRPSRSPWYPSARLAWRERWDDWGPVQRAVGDFLRGV